MRQHVSFSELHSCTLTNGNCNSVVFVDAVTSSAFKLATLETKAQRCFFVLFCFWKVTAHSNFWPFSQTSHIVLGRRSSRMAAMLNQLGHRLAPNIQPKESQKDEGGGGPTGNQSDMSTSSQFRSRWCPYETRQDSGRMRGSRLCIYIIDAWCPNTVKVDGQCFAKVDLLMPSFHLFSYFFLNIWMY